MICRDKSNSSHNAQVNQLDEWEMDSILRDDVYQGKYSDNLEVRNI